MSGPVSIDDLPVGVLSALERFDTPTLANAIEAFDVRSRAEGFASASVRAIFPEERTVLGRAVTGKIRSASPSREGYARRAWWDHVLQVPGPRIVVFEDVDDTPGVGAFWGEVQGNIHRALGCVGVVTNGSVRDLNEARAIPFHYFAGGVSVSHAYVRIVEFGREVTVGGLTVAEGDLIAADQHGVLSIPIALADKLPAAADRLIEREQTIVRLCRSHDLDLDELERISK